jgi:hypothetical protein
MKYDELKGSKDVHQYVDEEPPGNPSRHKEQPSQIAWPHVAVRGINNES